MKTANYQLQPFSSLIHSLKKLCLEKKNGMLFIITDTRQSASILLINGNITEITFASEKSEKALLLLKTTSQCRFHFSEGNKQAAKNKLIPHCSNETIFRKLSQKGVIEKKPVVLIVDDSKLVRKLVTETLDCRYEVHEAADGLAAIASMSRHKPDLILLDLIMPKMDGYKTLTIIRKNKEYTDIPVLILTSRDSLMDKLKGKMSKSDAYITKPFTPESLFKEVSFHLSTDKESITADKNT